MRFVTHCDLLRFSLTCTTTSVVRRSSSMRRSSCGSRVDVLARSPCIMSCKRSITSPRYRAKLRQPVDASSFVRSTGRCGATTRPMTNHPRVSTCYWRSPSRAIASSQTPASTIQDGGSIAQSTIVNFEHFESMSERRMSHARDLGSHHPIVA